MERSRADFVAPAPLFDRLVDLEPGPTHEVRPLRALTLPELWTSIRREVERILNTRSSLPLAELEDRELTVLDYGAADMASLGPVGDPIHRQMERHLARVIEAFEPRLRGVRLKVTEYQSNEGVLLLELTAALRTEHLSESVSFPVAVRTRERPNGV